MKADLANNCAKFSNKGHNYAIHLSTEIKTILITAGAVFWVNVHAVEIRTFHRQQIQRKNWLYIVNFLQPNRLI